MRRWRRWRDRQPSRILFVPASDPSPTIVAAGLRKRNRAVTAMIERRTAAPL